MGSIDIDYIWLFDPWIGARYSTIANYSRWLAPICRYSSLHDRKEDRASWQPPILFFSFLHSRILYHPNRANLWRSWSSPNYICGLHHHALSSHSLQRSHLALFSSTIILPSRIPSTFSLAVKTSSSLVYLWTTHILVARFPISEIVSVGPEPKLARPRILHPWMVRL